MPLIKYLSLLTICIVIFQIDAMGQCPPNLDFELGNYSNWEYYTGTCCAINTPSNTGPLASRHEIVSSGTDPYGGFSVVYPNGGNFSLKLGNDNAGSQAERARYYVHVPTNSKSYVLVFHYAVVLQDPGHIPSEQPRFQVSAYDSATGQLIPCSEVTYVSSPNLPGFKVSPVSSLVVFKSWSDATIFLGPEVAGKTVAIDFATGDCGLGAHFGYAYIDMDCDQFDLYYSVACTPGQTVKLKGPPGYNKYEWYDSTMVKYYFSGDSVYVAVPDTTTVFALQLTPFSGFGCMDTLYYTVANLSVKPTKDTTLCLDGNNTYFQLNAVAKGDAVPINYEWTPATGLSCTNCSNPVLNISSTKTYYVTVTDSNNCQKKDSVTVTIAPQVFAKIKVPADSICQYEHVTFADTNSKNPPGVIYYWQVDTGNIYTGTGTSKIEAGWITPGIKKVKLRVSNSYCNKYDSVEVYVKPNPLSQYEVKYNVCLDEVVRIYPKKYDSLTYYLWEIEGNIINDTTYSEYYDISWSTTGKKRVKLVTKSQNGCSTVFDSVIRVHEYPIGKIKYDNPNICIGDTVTFSTIPGEYYTYEWAPQGFFTSANRPEVKAVFNHPAVISLKVQTQWGCNTTDSIYLGTERCCKLTMPDAFAPNGSGRNTKFRIISQGIYTVHSFMIADRWGRVLFNSNDNSGWDGNYKGEPQPTGTYAYYIKYICASGDVQEMKGTLLLIR